MIEPESKLLLINGVLVLIAWVFVFPRINPKSVGHLMGLDSVLTGLSLLIAGLLYYGTGERFSLILFETNWFIFSILSMGVMEISFARDFIMHRNLK